MENCDFSLPYFTQLCKTPSRACHSTRCFGVCPNDVFIKNMVCSDYTLMYERDDFTVTAIFAGIYENLKGFIIIRTKTQFVFF